MKELRVKKNFKPGVCQTWGCKNNPQGRKFCSTCRKTQSRLKDPVKYAYNNVKHRAKQRGKEFTLTIEQFTEFCHKSQYIAGKGRKIGGLNIDRIDNNKGYTIDNIQVMEKTENIKKYYLDYDWQNKVAVVWSPDKLTAEEKEKLPF